MKNNEEIRNQEAFIHSEISQEKPIEKTQLETIEPISLNTEKIETIQKEIASYPPQEDIAPAPKGSTFSIPKKLKTGMLASLFTIGSMFAPKKSIAGGNEGGENAAKKEASMKIASEMKAVGGLAFYKGGIEKTPTGQDNAFENNPFGITKEDVYEMAQKYNFHTATNLDLQKDMYAYLENNRPDVLQAMRDAYGQTNAATFEDGILGSRTAFVMNELKKTPKLEKVPEVSLEKKTTQEITPRRVLVDQSYIINVRADGGNGAYYVVENAAALEKIENMLNGGVAHATYRSNYGQLTIDMNQSVFLSDNEQWMNTPEKRTLLGKTWHRDPKNPMYIIEDVVQETGNQDIARK